MKEDGVSVVILQKCESIECMTQLKQSDTPCISANMLLGWQGREEELGRGGANW